MEDLRSLIFTSRSSEIYEWDDNILLKLFFEGFDPELIAYEEINTMEAFKHGITKVNCYGHVQVGNRTGLLLEKVPGDTLMRLVIADVSFADTATNIQVGLHVKMHQAHTDKMKCYKARVRRALDSSPLSFLTKTEKATALRVLEALPDGDVILHLDCHTDNIMYDGKEATIIDWTTAARGVPAAEAATMRYLSNDAEMVPGLSDSAVAALRSLRRTQHLRYMSAYQAATNLSEEEIAAWRLPVLITRLGVWNVKSEAGRLREKILEEIKRYE
jgi:hypothetical protein